MPTARSRALTPASGMLARPSLFSALAGLAIGIAAIAAATAAEPLRGVIDAGDLRHRIDADQSLVVVDIRSGETRSAGEALFRAGHIPGSVHADYAHASWRLPRENTSVYLPEPAQFEALAGGLGISNDSAVVIVHEGHDATSFGAAARVYWSFKAMGHTSIAILDGGYRAWRADASRPIELGAPTPLPAIYEARRNPGVRATLRDVLAAEKTGAILVDSRPESFFSGLEKHKAVRSFGHIPNAVSIPHSRALDADFKLRDVNFLRSEFRNAASGAPVITYCNTGHWGATDWFVLHEVLELTTIKLYDGSMLEYSLEKPDFVANPRANSGS